jgi:hypothetical protein
MTRNRDDLHLAVLDGLQRAGVNVGSGGADYHGGSDPLVASDRRTPAPGETPVAAEPTGEDVPRPLSAGAHPARSASTGARP